ncbi:pre-mRNA-splicing factor ISY1 [Gilbertella persicaria]|uniref:pre-mRNA-splicing factor ISY1 n=1 Tax=Gilbertella persicaria TaxID=101096 RepID=UPI00221FEA70|nr:pre-mRNA-splicing factor ISY1 [Gilbertella persicaria]KAI8082481.1 pre-mRNA-splicing factor ISY1 [Gilbertella persicaria]
MARNEEKAQSMLYRFREAQAAELGLGKPRVRRPAFAGAVDTIAEAEKWRKDLLSEVSRKIAKIQDVGLSDYQVRDLNDDINRLMGQKYHWEKRIKELGGPDYSRAGPRMFSYEGREAPGTRGYRYYGRARDLPGVRELFETVMPESISRSRRDINRDIDADYYGYRDEDGVLLEYERELEKQLAEKTANAPDEEIEQEEQEDQQQQEVEHDPLPPQTTAVKVPSQKEVEAYLLQRRKQQVNSKLYRLIAYVLP